MIDRRLLASQAKKEGVDTTPDFISRKRRGEEDLLISMLSAQRFKSVALPSARDTDAYIASHPAMFANRQMWELDQIQYRPPTDPAIQAEINKTKSFAGAAGRSPEEWNHRRPPEESARYRGRPGRTVPENFSPSRLASRSSSGSATAPSPASLSRASRSRWSGDQARPIAAEVMRKEQSAKDMANRVSSLRKAAKIEYQKGFAPPGRQEI